MQDWVFLMLQTSIKLLSNVSFTVLQLSYDFCNTMQGEQRKTQLCTFFLRETSNIFPHSDLPCSRYFLSALQSSEWSKQSQSSTKNKSQVFSTKSSLLPHSDHLATGTANLFRKMP